ncbi:MAG: phage portal protein [Planctomycetaceae bacterium]|nr:phage portal protein [Planctomycetaceae bacterium]
MGLLQRIFRSDSLENPSVSLSDPAAVEKLFGDQKSISGVRVTEKKALGHAPLWRGLNLISDSVAKLALNVYKMNEDDYPEIQKKHPAYKLMRRKPNHLMTAGIFKKTLTYHAMFYGNGYAAIFRDGRNVPVALSILNPSTFPLLRNGELWYVTTLPSGEQRKIPARDILHLKGLAFDGLHGYSVIEIMADTLGLNMAASDYAGQFFGQGASASGVLMMPGHLDKEAHKQAMKDFAKIATGLKNAHKVGVLQDGVKWQPLTIKASEAQLLESRKYGVKEVANILGIPPHKLGDDSRTGYSSIEAENQSYLDDALDTWLCRWEEECWDKLLSEGEKNADQHEWEFDRDALLRMSKLDQTREYAMGRQWGLYSINDGRRRKNLPPVDGGDVYLSPSNMVDATKLDEEPEDTPQDSPDEPDTDPTQQPNPDDPDAQEDTNPLGQNSHDPVAHEAQIDLVVERLQRLTQVEQKQIVKAAEREKNFLGWLDKFLPQQEKRLSDGLEAILSSIFKMRQSATEAQLVASGGASDYMEELRGLLLDICGRSTTSELRKNVESIPYWEESYLRRFAEELIEQA